VIQALRKTNIDSRIVDKIEADPNWSKRWIKKPRDLEAEYGPSAATVMFETQSAFAKSVMTRHGWNSGDHFDGLPHEDWAIALAEHVLPTGWWTDMTPEAIKVTRLDDPARHPLDSTIDFIAKETGLGRKGKRLNGLRQNPDWGTITSNAVMEAVDAYERRQRLMNRITGGSP
jgi:hypothetical protein